MTKTLPKGFKFPSKLPGESYQDYAIRIKVHPSCKDRVSLHSDDIDIKDVTDEALDRGFIIAPASKNNESGDSNDEKSKD